MSDDFVQLNVTISYKTDRLFLSPWSFVLEILHMLFLSQLFQKYNQVQSHKKLDCAGYSYLPTAPLFSHLPPEHLNYPKTLHFVCQAESKTRIKNEELFKANY
jgi:hypothetical protein